jgi:AbrB family looped-hinge helix DNA binding protein
VAGYTSSVTSKGQVTVPAEVRRYMDIQEGDRVLFVREAGRVYIGKLPSETLSADLYGALRRPGTAPLDLEQASADARARRSVRYDSLNSSLDREKRKDGS